MSALFALLVFALPLEPLVPVADAIPDAVVDLRYATANNFLKQKLYPDDARCLLLKSTVTALARAAASLRRQGYRLYVYDCYRPVGVQWQMWKAFPKPGYVADPRTGSLHNRGAAVDLSLAHLDGGEVEMPTAFDTFSKKAHHSATDVTPAASLNRQTLRAAMEDAGFVKNAMEWWHYQLPLAARYPVRDAGFSP